MRKFQIKVNGNEYEVEVEELTGQSESSKGLQRKEVKTKKPSQGAIKIEAPMQGKIIDIRVSEGDPVKSGHVVLVLEAMKMENEVVSTHDGTVASIPVSVGQTVDAGDVIISLN